MTDLSKIQALIDKIHIVADSAASEQILDVLSPEKTDAPVRIAFVNAHALNLCYQNENFLDDLLACDFSRPPLVVRRSSKIRYHDCSPASR